MLACSCALTPPICDAYLQQTHAIDEIKVLDRFFEMLDENPDRAFYGWKHVCLAHANQAIEALMITDELFRYAEQGRMWIR